jgi:succinate-semialdehyde dehydrogenase/glutarate-semialdehyde dehydrogenase
MKGVNMAVRNIAQPPGDLLSTNPATGEILRAYPLDTEAALDSKLQLAADSFSAWRRTSFHERSRLMLHAAEILEDDRRDLARLMTLEMGKPLSAAVQEAEKCARGCRYYAERAEEFLADEPAQTDATHTFVCYQPLGPVLAIMPWNFPFWQVFRFAAPALMAGNVGLLKHAASVPQCALAIEDIFPRRVSSRSLSDAAYR